MIQLPPIAPPRWSQDQAVAFEAARECLGDAIAICVAGIATEEARACPDASRLAELESELVELTAKRRELKLTDSEAVASVRAIYGALVRGHREQRHSAAA